jgi:hypothetical protein
MSDDKGRSEMKTVQDVSNALIRAVLVLDACANISNQIGMDREIEALIGTSIIIEETREMLDRAQDILEHHCLELGRANEIEAMREKKSRLKMS